MRRADPLSRILNCPEVAIRVWPVERRLMGMEVCRQFRSDLVELDITLRVSLHKYHDLSDISPEILQSHLCRFANSLSVVIIGAVPRCNRLILPEDQVLLDGAPSPSLIADCAIRTAQIAWLTAIPTSFCKALLAALTSSAADCLSHNLVKLDLTSTNMGCEGACKLAESLGLFTALKELELANNFIAETGAIKLASALTRCAALSVLNLCFNHVGAGAAPILQALQHCPDLTRLDLRGNGLVASSLEHLRGLSVCRRLAVLDLGYDRMGPLRTLNFLDELPLRRLSIHFARFPSRMTSRVNIFRSLQNCTALTWLDLAHSNIRHAGVRQLAGVVSSLTSLRHLDISHVQCTTRPLASLGASLRHCTALASLKLANCIPPGGFRISNSGLTALDLGDNQHMDLENAAAIVALNTCLRDLKVNACAGGRHLDKLAAALQCCTQLASLDLEGIPMADSGAALLARALSGHSSLSSLDLNNAYIGPEGVASVGLILAGNVGCLRRLHLGNFIPDMARTRIGPQGAASLAALLVPCEQLTMLDLHGAQTLDAGLAALCGVLPGLSSLVRLDLAFNSITPLGASCLASTLQQTSSLGRLNLTGNPLQDAGLAAIADYLASRPENLRVLSIADCGCGDGGATAMADALGAGTGLSILDMGHQHASIASVERIAAAVRRCGSVSVMMLGCRAAAEHWDAMIERVRGEPRVQLSFYVEGERVINTDEDADGNPLFLEEDGEEWLDEEGL